MNVMSKYMEVSIQSRNDGLKQSRKDCMYINFDCMNIPTGYIVTSGKCLYALLIRMVINTKCLYALIIRMDRCIKCLYDLTISIYEYFTVYKYSRYIKKGYMYVYQQYI